MWSIIAARVVDLPEPVVPVSSTIRAPPRRAADDRRQRQLADRLDRDRDGADDERDRAALAEGVEAEAREPGIE
jgi:hypothetical protein